MVCKTMAPRVCRVRIPPLPKMKKSSQLDFSHDFASLFEKVDQVYRYGKTSPKEAWKDMEEMGEDIYMLTLLCHRLMAEVEDLSEMAPRDRREERDLCPICCDFKWSRPHSLSPDENGDRRDYTKKQCKTCGTIRKDKENDKKMSTL